MIALPAQTLDLAIEVIGWAGAVMILVAYLLLTTGRLEARSIRA